MNNKNLALMNDIMGAVTQTEEWQEIQMCDPAIVAAEARFSAAMEQAKAAIPGELYSELSDAHTAAILAIGDVGVLFGIHVADAIRDVAARPLDLSRYALKGGI